MNNSRTYKLSPQAEENTEFNKSNSVSSREFNVLRKNLNGAYAQLTVQAGQIATKVSITDLNTTLSNYSTITQTAEQIATRVATTDYNGNTIASIINQTATTIKLSASKLELSGYTTFSNLANAGETTINGSNITTGTLNASLITTGTLNADRINTNTLNVNKLQTGTTLGGAGLIAFNSGNITLYGSSINDASLNFNYNGAITRIYNYGSNAIGISSNLYIGGNITIDGNITSVNGINSQTILPRANNTYSLGASSFRWSSIWQTSGAVTGSDRVLKKDIQPIDESVEFIKALKPVSYVMKDGNSGRTHYGFIAQEVKQALDKVGKDRALYIDPVVKEIPENGAGYAKGLRYDEFIAPAISVIQNLLYRVEELENELHSRTL